MSSDRHRYLDCNAARGELSKIFASDMTAAEDNAGTAEQHATLPKPICT